MRRPSRRGEIPARASNVRTLEDALIGVLGELAATGAATCPVCAEHRLTPSGCGRCGARLS